MEEKENQTVESTVPDEVTEPVEETVDDAESVTDDNSDESEFDDSDDSVDDGDEQESYESEEEFLAQYKLPGNPKTLKEAMTMAKEATRKLHELQQQEAEKQTPDTQKTQQDRGGKKGFFPRDVFTGQFERLIQDGQIQGDSVSTYKYLGKVLDQASNAQTDMVEEAVGALVTELARVRSHLRDSAWHRFEAKNKGRVERERLEKIMDSMGYYDYGKAFRQLAVDDPSLLKEIERRAEQRGTNKNKKGLARTMFPTRGKQEQPKKLNVKAYLRPDGKPDMAKLARLPEKESDAIIDSIASGKF